MIQSLRLQNYRSYRDESFEIDTSVNIVVGPNASGKTNFIEAILVACQGKSFRNSDDDLIFHTSGWARIDMQLTTEHRVVKLQKEPDKTSKQFEIDGVKLFRLLRPRHVPVVIFEPNHLLMFHGGPEARREYIDTLLEKLELPFAALRKDYKRALYQRNTLLKSGHATTDTIFVWDVRLSELGGTIAVYRQELLKSIATDIQQTYRGIADSNVSLRLMYKASCQIDSYSSDMLQKLKRHLSSDILKGYTSVGPHRDDIEIRFDEHQAKEVASRGEVRTAILALKIQEAKLLEHVYERKPIMLLDDVFSELDGARRRHLTEFLRDHQTFITTTDADIVVQHFMNACNIIPVSTR